MDEDDVPLDQLRKASTIISNDQMLTPLDPAIEFQFDNNEIFNFDLTNFDLYTYYEKSLNMDDSVNNTESTETNTHTENSEEEDMTQLNDSKKSATIKNTADESTGPVSTSDPVEPVDVDGEDTSTSELSKPEESRTLNTESNSSQAKMTRGNTLIIQCGFCQFYTVSLHGLRVHMRKHGNKKGKKYKCYYCNFLTHKSYYLKQHGVYVHGSAYSCELCLYRSYSNSKMMSHIRHIHC